MGENGKTIILGVTGCIAAYKACGVLRALQKLGYDVYVMMTENAKEFIGKATFEALSGHRVVDTLFGMEDNPIPHIDLATRADAMIIAPCTGNMLAKIAHGISDDAVSTTVLAAHCPVVVAPAMNVHMYRNQATQENMRILRERGVHLIVPETGRLACGDIGEGKLPDPIDIVAELLGIISRKRDLEGKSFLITAGPTLEPIDPVRYISNHSSGKMGYALASAALERGAKVCLISGPVNIEAPDGVQLYRVETALEMMQAAQKIFPECDVAICTAAVCDMRPEICSEEKLKKGDSGSAFDSLGFVPNPDILASLAAMKAEGQVVVGFAAETEQVLENARKKLASKKADIIVANDVSNGAVFGADDNKAVIISKAQEKDIPLCTKRELADLILDEIVG